MDEETANKIIKEFHDNIDSQESLGKEFEDVLNDNLWDMYIEDVKYDGTT